jgi:hypothetical protein
MRKRRVPVFLAWAVLLLAGALDAVSGEGKATLDRTEDPIILKGSDLPGLLGSPGNRVRVMAVRDGALVPVPFQIDPVDDKGKMIFRKVIKSGGFVDNPDAEASRPIGKNDELVFMAGDLGDRAAPGALPPGPAVEIELTDPLDKSRGWAYAVCPEGPLPPLSNVRYVRYLPGRDTVVSSHLNFGFTDPEYPAVLTFLAIGDGISDPDGLVDLLDRFRMEISATFKLGLGTVVRRETDLVQAVAGYNEGPVRVVKLLRYSVLLIGSIPSPSVERMNASYRSAIVFPNDVSVPFSPGVVLEDGVFNLCFDFTSDLKGSKMYHAQFPEPILVNGKMEEAEERFASGFPLWAVMSAPFGGVVGVVDVEEHFLKIPGVVPELTYLDDSSFLTEGEDAPGTYGSIGWRFGGLNHLPGGDYKIDLVLYGLAGEFEKGDEKQFLDLVHHPLQIKTRAVRAEK